MIYYKLVRADRSHGLVDNVTLCIKGGFNPHGSPFYGRGHFYQAMICDIPESPQQPTESDRADKPLNQTTEPDRADEPLNQTQGRIKAITGWLFGR